MKMLHSARVKLTLWYVAIIMFFSLLFSSIIYMGINRELARFRFIQQRRLEFERKNMIFPPRNPPFIDPKTIAAAQMRLTLILISINLGILGFSTLAAYILAGKTLQPIKEMVDEQNRFITDASHELRTPLTSLRSEIEVNLRDKKLSLTDAKSLLKSNLEEVVSLQTLSDSLMTLAQYQKKNNHFIFELQKLYPIIENAIKTLNVSAEKKHIKIANMTKNIEAYVNKQSLAELFVILIDNAIKYSKNNSSIIISSQKIDRSVKITVKDHGSGIDPMDLPHIFERFYRSDKARSKDTIKGYGLGLSIAKKIVDLHNGTIGAESNKNKGTVFTIMIPQKQTI